MKKKVTAALIFVVLLSIFIVNATSSKDTKLSRKLKAGKWYWRMNYEIEQIDPNVIFIVTVDDRPIVFQSGEICKFYRKIDAERWIEFNIAQTAEEKREMERVEESAKQALETLPHIPEKKAKVRTRKKA